jgi:hypothetical protein
MNEEQKIKWWERFCNSCKNEDCKACDPPIIEKDSQLSDFLEGTPFQSFFEKITPPSNYIHVYGVK